VPARVTPESEIIDYAHDGRFDAPSGTARWLAARLRALRAPETTVPVDATTGNRDARRYPRAFDTFGGLRYR
jgi:4-hydroxy-tetrahydrodipicolinate reductase